MLPGLGNPVSRPTLTIALPAVAFQPPEPSRRPIGMVLLALFAPRPDYRQIRRLQKVLLKDGLPPWLHLR